VKIGRSLTPSPTQYQRWSSPTADKHPNVALREQLDVRDVAAAVEVFAEDVVWHFFNPRLPEIQGDYVGLAGIRTFFEKIGGATAGTFRIEPVSLTPVGDELVVAHSRNSLTLGPVDSYGYCVGVAHLSAG